MKKIAKVDKFLIYANLLLLPLALGIAAGACSSTYLNHVIQQSNAKPEDIRRALNNHQFIRQKVFPHSYQEELDNIRIYVRSTDSINYAALSVAHVSKKFRYLMGSLRRQENFDAQEQNDYSDKIKGEVNAYFYKIYKLSGELTQDPPTIYLSADNSVVERFRDQVFDGNLGLAQDMIFFHEFTHHLQKTVVPQLHAKTILTIEDFKKALQKQHIQIENFSDESITILHTLYQESVADVMALQLLEAKYPALDIEYLADNLALFRNEADIAHFTSLALMPLENSHTKTFTQMYEIAQKNALLNLTTLLRHGLDAAHQHVEKLSQNRGTFELYKSQYKLDSKYFDIKVNYNHYIQQLDLDKSVIEPLKPAKYKIHNKKTP